MTDLIGLVAAMLTTISFLPQTLLVLRTGRTDGISLCMYALFTTGVAGWLLYGVLVGSLPIILANAVTLALAATILGLKIRSVWGETRTPLPARP
ncbi:MAG: SemiSWEET transporter [Hyphomonadaceae bacterium]|nr:SemiSWEET transporter [Hyphomonadaceae bacterium]